MPRFFPHTTPDISAAAAAAATIAVASAGLAASGFSRRTCLPAVTDSETRRECRDGGTPTYTAS
jgi:hypothetical protein